MLDDGARIGLAQGYAGGAQDQGIGGPGAVDDGVGEAGQFRDPAADVAAISVEFLALAHGAEDAEVGGGVGAGAGDPLPAGGVVGAVGVEQGVPEPGLALSPVDQQVFDQEGRHQHADAVVHEAGGPQFAHAGVDHRIAGLAPCPGGEAGRIIAPREGVEGGLEVAGLHLRVVEQQGVAELAPAQFGLELVGLAAQRGPGVDGGIDRGPDLAWADFAEMQVRRQARDGFRGGDVAAVGVAGEARLQKLGQPGLRAGLTRRPEGEPARPVRLCRLEAPRLEALAVRPDSGRGQGFRGRVKGGEVQAGLGGAPEGREDLEGLAALVAHGPGLGEQAGIEASGRQTLGLKPGLQGRVAIGDAGVIEPVPDDLGCAGFVGDGHEFGRRVAPTQDEARAQGFERRVQPREGDAEPPQRGGAGCAQALRLVQNIERDDRTAGLDSVAQGRIVAEAQVASEPDDDRCGRVFVVCRVHRRRMSLCGKEGRFIEGGKVSAGSRFGVGVSNGQVDKPRRDRAPSGPLRRIAAAANVRGALAVSMVSLYRRAVAARRL